MNFYGAATTMVRDQGRRTAEASRTIEDLLSRLGSRLLALPWEGADADAFRGRWDATRQQSLGCLADMSRRGSELIDHAQEQDMASAPDNGPAGAAGAPGRPGLPSTGVNGPLGAGTALAFGAMGGHLNAPDIGRSPYTRPYLGDSMRHESGTHGIEGEIKVKDENGNWTTLSLDAEGKATLEAEAFLGDKVKSKFQGPLLGGNASIEMGDYINVSVNSDGTVTYTIGTRVKGAAELGIDPKYFYVEGKAGFEETLAWSVTVPAGTNPVDAVTAFPWDPRTIPPGGSIELSESMSHNYGIAAGVGTHQAHLVAGKEWDVENSHAMKVSRDESGYVTVTEGPESVVGSTWKGGWDIGDVELFMRATRERTEATTETAVYSLDEDGIAAYQEYGVNKHPNGTKTPGVMDRYTDTYHALTDEIGVGGQFNKHLGFDISGSMYVSEAVTRTDTQGNTEFFGQLLPDGTGSHDKLEVFGGTRDGEIIEPNYRMTVQDSGGVLESHLQSDRGGVMPAGTDGIFEIQYTQTEIEQMAKNSYEKWFGEGTYHPSTHAYGHYVENIIGGGPEALAKTWEDYNLQWGPGPFGIGRVMSVNYIDTENPGIVVVR